MSTYSETTRRFFGASLVVDQPAPRYEEVMKIARRIIAARKRGGITPAAAKRLAAFKPFSRPTPSLKLAMGSMPRAPRAPRPFGMPKRRSPRRVVLPK